MELSNSNIKNNPYTLGNGNPKTFLMFSQEKYVLIFQKTETLKIYLYLRKRNFSYI